MISIIFLNIRHILRNKEDLSVAKLSEIKERYDNRLEPSDEDVKWLIEQAEKGERYEKALKEIMESYNDGMITRETISKILRKLNS